MRGGFNYSKLSPFDKFLMALLKWKIKSKNPKKLTSDEIGMLAIYDKPVNFTARKSIDEIVAYVKS
ncbi:hypothetical protein CLJU_c38840 [Clostridium ljungdahlii DSM 13528]|uniref:Uncharacterized protein n=2 Tax=Clostridium TaxID=1485 RepID=D8GUN2_CLOLD|nr:hypothetical protein CLJU_c38840 [Clostridium ljungdahlii DSM 13528]